MRCKKNYTLTLIQSASLAEENEGTITYGILMQRGNAEICIKDISPNKAAVQRLIRRLRRCPVSIEALPEVVEDYLIELYTI